MSIEKDTKKTKDGRQYYFRIMINGKSYKSKRFLTREEARKEEAGYILKYKHQNKALFETVGESYFKYLKYIK